MSDAPILVTSAGGQTGSIGRSIVRGLRARGLPVRKNWYEVAEDFSAVLGRKITYVPSTLEHFRQLLRSLVPWLPDHPALHLENLARQDGGDRYIAEVTDDVERLLGHPATSFRSVLKAETWRFEKGAPDVIRHRDLKDFERDARATG